MRLSVLRVAPGAVTPFAGAKRLASALRCGALLTLAAPWRAVINCDASVRLLLDARFQVRRFLLPWRAVRFGLTCRICRRAVSTCSSIR